jgi:hypothetical protein
MERNMFFPNSNAIPTACTVKYLLTFWKEMHNGIAEDVINHKMKVCSKKQQYANMRYQQYNNKFDM